MLVHMRTAPAAMARQTATVRRVLATATLAMPASACVTTALRFAGPDPSGPSARDPAQENRSTRGISALPQPVR
jgi:hypothetical protein